MKEINVLLLLSSEFLLSFPNSRRGTEGGRRKRDQAYIERNWKAELEMVGIRGSDGDVVAGMKKVERRRPMEERDKGLLCVCDCLGEMWSGSYM
jgi:hypothetical protein